MHDLNFDVDMMFIIENNKDFDLPKNALAEHCMKDLSFFWKNDLMLR